MAINDFYIDEELPRRSQYPNFGNEPWIEFLPWTLPESPKPPVRRKILIMGLPGTGKTTLAHALAPMLNAVWFNADAVQPISTANSATPLKTASNRRDAWVGFVTAWLNPVTRRLRISFALRLKLARHLGTPLLFSWINQGKSL